MIKFFRKIRFKFIDAGKTAQYLKYAIGEVALVMIGILLALSINNWNTQRIQNINGLKLSHRLLEETKRNSVSVLTEIEKVNHVMSSALGILHLMTEDYSNVDEHLVDSLVYKLYSGASFEFNSAVLDEALSTGEVSNFKDDSVKNLVYSLPTIIDAIRVDEADLEKLSSTFFTEFLYDNYSLRQMDYKFSDSNIKLGKSKLRKLDNRKILESHLFENLVDDMYYKCHEIRGLYTNLANDFAWLTERLKGQIKNEKL
jgi:hypothetical protein